jgi:hypothetical protein
VTMKEREGEDKAERGETDPSRKREERRIERAPWKQPDDSRR